MLGSFADLCASVTCPSNPETCQVYTCDPATGGCNAGPVECPVTPGPKTMVVRLLSADNFTAGAGKITFSEMALGTQNPVYAPANYGADPSKAPTVSFGGWFAGQDLATNPAVICPGGAASGCVSGTPTSPLTLDTAAQQTRLILDGANPTSPVLTGSPNFNGPIAVLFSQPFVGVGVSKYSDQWVS